MVVWFSALVRLTLESSKLATAVVDGVGTVLLRENLEDSKFGADVEAVATAVTTVSFFLSKQLSNRFLQLSLSSVDKQWCKRGKQESSREW
jgi:hypothetical protein